MAIIENEYLKVSVNTKGAELDSIFNKQTKLEYLWSGDAAFWGKKSPVLFPIIGTVKNDTYLFDEKEYHLSRHGFAREMEFSITAHTDDMITFTLESNGDTLLKFPFPFQFNIVYSIAGNELRVNYQVVNTGKKEMFFSVGGHPAFKVPLTGDTLYSDYKLVFNERENAPRWPISKDGLIEANPVDFMTDTDELRLVKELFYKDAIVFKSLRSTSVKLVSDKSEHGFTFDFTGFPFLGIWAAKNADFVCIEPWCGIADSVTTDQHIETKEGIVSLSPANTFNRTWTVKLW